MGAGQHASGQQTEAVTLTGHAGIIGSLAFSPDSRILASASTDGSVRLWEVLTGKERAVLKYHSGDYAPPLAFSPDGRLLASGGRDGTVRLWPLAGRKPRTLKGLSGAVTCLCFAPAGTALAVGGGKDRRTGKVRLWDVRSGRALAALRGHTELVNALSFFARRPEPGGRELQRRRNCLGDGQRQGTGLAHGAPRSRLVRCVRRRWPAVGLGWGRRDGPALGSADGEAAGCPGGARQPRHSGGLGERGAGLLRRRRNRPAVGHGHGEAVAGPGAGQRGLVRGAQPRRQVPRGRGRQGHSPPLASGQAVGQGRHEVGAARGERRSLSRRLYLSERTFPSPEAAQGQLNRPWTPRALRARPLVRNPQRSAWSCM